MSLTSRDPISRLLGTPGVPTSAGRRRRDTETIAQPDAGCAELLRVRAEGEPWAARPAVVEVRLGGRGSRRTHDEAHDRRRRRNARTTKHDGGPARTSTRSGGHRRGWKYVRRRPTLPPGRPGSTIGADG